MGLYVHGTLLTPSTVFQFISIAKFTSKSTLENMPDTQKHNCTCFVSCIFGVFKYPLVQQNCIMLMHDKTGDCGWQDEWNSVYKPKWLKFLNSLRFDVRSEKSTKYLFVSFEPQKPLVAEEKTNRSQVHPQSTICRSASLISPDLWFWSNHPTRKRTLFCFLFLFTV